MKMWKDYKDRKTQSIVKRQSDKLDLSTFSSGELMDQFCTSEIFSKSGKDSLLTNEMNYQMSQAPK